MGKKIGKKNLRVSFFKTGKKTTFYGGCPKNNTCRSKMKNLINRLDLLKFYSITLEFCQNALFFCPVSYDVFDKKFTGKCTDIVHKDDFRDGNH